MTAEQPHKTGLSLWGGFFCFTENQPYCNYEAPEDE